MDSPLNNVNDPHILAHGRRSHPEAKRSRSRSQFNLATENESFRIKSSLGRRNSMGITLGIKNTKLAKTLDSSPLYKTHPSTARNLFGENQRNSNVPSSPSDTRPLVSAKKAEESDIVEIDSPQEAFVKVESEYTKLQDRLKLFMNTWYMSLITMIFTIYALYAEDLRVGVCPKSLDFTFFILHCLAAVYFLFELAILTFADINYRMSMFMPLDTIALLSIIVDIVASGVAMGFARIFRVATRVGRLIRALRFLVAAKQFRDQKQAYSDEVGERRENSRPIEQGEVNSRFGKYLTNVVTKRVIVLFIVMVLLIPLNEENIFSFKKAENDTIILLQGTASSLAMCYDPSYPMCNSANAVKNFLQTYIESHSVTSLAHDVYADSNSTNEWSNNIFYDLAKLTIKIDGEEREKEERRDFQETVRHEHYINAYSNTVHVEAVFDLTKKLKIDAIYNVVQTTILIIVLVTFATFLQNFTKMYVISPVERLLIAVRRMAKDPFHNWDEEDFETHKDKPTITHMHGDKEENQVREEYEVEVLHRTVRDISQLLGVGFGRAGWTIIRNAIVNASSMDLLLPGKHIQGVFMFGQIRHFAALTDCLQENIFSFVNCVAEIIHEKTVENKGATNKNIGDSFLSVWCFPHKVTVNNRLIRTQDVESIHFNGSIPLELTYLADRAFICVVKNILSILRSKELDKYYKREEIRKLLGDVVQKMGFGLHVGWAIEGAVGSRHKLDATYLSPNVNISARLETATAQYGVFVLLSGEFVNLLCRSAQRLCRPVDMVQVKGSIQKVEIYTIDIPLDCEIAENKKEEPHMLSQVDQIYKWRHSFPCSTIEFRCDADLVALKNYQDSQKNFLDEYLEGFSLYSRGDWKRAHTWFKKALKLKPNDGPAKELVRVIESSNYMPSPTFVTKGRSLTRK